MSERYSTGMTLTAFSSAVGTSMPTRVAWKGKTFQQVVSSLQKNHNTAYLSKYGVADTMRAQPVKHYRKEIASIDTSNGLVYDTSGHTWNYSSAKSVSIDDLNRPNGTIMTHRSGQKGLDTIHVDPNERPRPCTTQCTTQYMSAETNARRRIRSSGIMKPAYNSTSLQYLNNRNKSFENNQYHYLQQGLSSVASSTTLYQVNAGNTYRTQSAGANAIYDPSGHLSTCHVPGGTSYTRVVYKPNNSKFAQQGAVDAGSLILRKKFDTITNNTVLFRKAYGNTVAAAMGYGGSDSVYTYKDKIQYPRTRLPISVRANPHSVLPCNQSVTGAPCSRRLDQVTV